MTDVYDPVAHGLYVGTWRTDLPDWKIHLGTLPVDPLPYTQIVSGADLTATSPLRMQRNRTTIVNGGTPSTTITATTTAVTDMMTVNWSKDALGNLNETYVNQGSQGLSLSIENPDRYDHLRPELDLDPSDPLYALIWDDPNVVGVELENGYVFLWDPVGGGKDTVLTEAQYLTWNPGREWAEGSGAYESDIWAEPAAWETATVPFAASYTNSVDEPGPGGTLWKWPTIGEMQHRYDFGAWPSAGGFPYQPRDGGSTVHTGKRGNSPTAPPTTGTFTVVVVPSVRHLYAQFSVLATEYIGFAGADFDAGTNIKATASATMGTGYVGVATSPTRWRLIYATPQGIRPAPLRQSGRSDGLIGAARQGAASSMFSAVRQGRSLVR